jgi:hypothetical protein
MAHPTFLFPVYVLITKPVCIFYPLAVGFAKPVGSIMAGIIGEAKIQTVVPAGFIHFSSLPYYLNPFALQKTLAGYISTCRTNIALFGPGAPKAIQQKALGSYPQGPKYRDGLGCRAHASASKHCV